MFKKLAFPILLLFLACPSFAADEGPAVNIRGAEKPVAGDDFVELTGELAQSKPNGWQGAVYEWKVFNGYKERKFFKTEADGSKIAIVPPRNGKNLLIVLTVSHLITSKDNDGKTVASVRVSSTHTVLTIEGAEPQPDPPPGPPPSPPPSPPKKDDPAPPQPEVLPDGEFKLAQVAYDAAVKVGKKKGAAALAASYALSAQIIVKDKLFDVPAILKDARARNQKALEEAGVDEENWQGFAAELEVALRTLNKEGKLVLASHIATAFSEIALGLEKAAK